MSVIIVGMFLGIGLLTTKYCVFWLLTSKKDEETGRMRQRIWPKWILFGEPLPLRDRIHDSTFLLFCVDFIGGWAGMHVLGAFGATNLAMIAMVSYTMMCMTTLMWQFITSWCKNKFKKFIPQHKPESWLEDY